MGDTTRTEYEQARGLQTAEVDGRCIGITSRGAQERIEVLEARDPDAMARLSAFAKVQQAAKLSFLPAVRHWQAEDSVVFAELERRAGVPLSEALARSRLEVALALCGALIGLWREAKAAGFPLSALRVDDLAVEQAGLFLANATALTRAAAPSGHLGTLLAEALDMAVAPMGHLCLVKRMVVEDLRSGKTTAEDASEQLRRELPPAEAPWTQQQRPNDEQSVIFNLLGAELELREQEELCGREICDSDILERQSVEPSAVRHLDLVSDLAMADAGGQPPPPEPLAQRGSGRGHMGLLVGAGFACLGVATMVATSTVGRGRGQQQEPPRSGVVDLSEPFVTPVLSGVASTTIAPAHVPAPAAEALPPAQLTPKPVQLEPSASYPVRPPAAKLTVKVIDAPPGPCGVGLRVGRELFVSREPASCVFSVEVAPQRTQSLQVLELRSGLAMHDEWQVNLLAGETEELRVALRRWP